jgi:hypothetical protein
MYRILPPVKDTYVTNRIINNQFRATDANVGQAGTLDVFKLYDESTISGETNPIELSRILLTFNLDPLRSMTSSILDISNPTFKCTLRLSDVYGGQTTPSNFKLIVFPLSRSFDEGIGRDVIGFTDLDSCNYITASVNRGAVDPWTDPGAGRQGLLGSSDIDIISSGNLLDGNGIVPLWREQSFSTGEEDLEIDVTKIVSATLAGIIPDCGFRISYSGSQETDTFTRFVKRFASRNTVSISKRPQLRTHFNDAVTDNHKTFFFNLTGSLFLNNHHRGIAANILSGAANNSVSGSNCAYVTLVSESFTRQFNVSQFNIGQNYITGVYVSTFAISEFDSNPALRRQIALGRSASFTEIWGSRDGTIGYYTGSLVINSISRTAFDNTPSRLFVNITNLQTSYDPSELKRFRVFVRDIDTQIVAVKLPIELPSEYFDQMYYRVRDYETGEVMIPFETQSNGTLMSVDRDGMYYDFYMDSLPRGRTYVFDFMIKADGSDLLFLDVAAKFRIS